MKKNIYRVSTGIIFIISCILLLVLVNRREEPIMQFVIYTSNRADYSHHFKVDSNGLMVAYFGTRRVFYTSEPVNFTRFLRRVETRAERQLTEEELANLVRLVEKAFIDVRDGSEHTRFGQQQFAVLYRGVTQEFCCCQISRERAHYRMISDELLELFAELKRLSPIPILNRW